MLFSRARHTETPDIERSITINNRKLQVAWTRAANNRLADLATPLYVDMQLYFSCLVKKQLLFHDTPPDAGFTPVTEKLFVRFHPVTSQACLPEEAADGQPTLPISTESVLKMTPRRLFLDFREGNWLGEYQFTEGK